MVPVRRRWTNLPWKALKGNIGSGAAIESPRRRNPSSPRRARKRCRKRRSSRRARTISPGWTSSRWQSAISTMSPGHTEGSMLSPRTRRRKRPPRRNASAARAERFAFQLSCHGVIVSPASGSLSRVLTLRGGGANLSARERKGLKDPLMAERRFLIGLLVFTQGGGLLHLARGLILRHKSPTQAIDSGLIRRFRLRSDLIAVYYTATPGVTVARRQDKERTTTSIKRKSSTSACTPQTPGQPSQGQRKQHHPERCQGGKRGRHRDDRLPMQKCHPHSLDGVPDGH